MATHLTSNLCVGANGLYDPGTPEVRMHSPNGVPNHVSVVFGGLTVTAFDTDGLAHLRNLAGALNDAADKYQSAIREGATA